MKRKEIWIRQVFLVLIVALIATACDDPADLGMELLPNTDLISVRSTVDYNNSAYVFSEDSLRTDGDGRSLLGSIADPIFGRTTIDLACQYRLTFYPDYQDDAVADSLFLYLFYKDFYGDTVTPQRLKIYELGQSIYDTENYYQDADLSSLKKEPALGEYEFIPKRTITQDTTTQALDTLYQTIKIPLDMSFAERLLSADSVDISNIDNFLEFFKGIYIGVEDVNNNGTIVTLNMLSNSAISGSAIVMYYRETNAETGEQDTLTTPLIASSLSTRINSYKHDYSGTPFDGKINSEEDNAEQIYIQSTGGLRSKIYIPDLGSWRDSSNVAINKAELVFQIDTLVSNVKKYPPPTQLLLTVIDEDGTEYLPKDYNFSSFFYGGKLNTSDYTYRFNIAQQMQEIVKEKWTNNGFFLSTANKTGEYKRVVLKGSQENNGIKLIIAYSKVLQ